MIERIWSVLEKNRWTVIALVLGLVLWLVAGCWEPNVQSPTRPTVTVTAVELETDFEIWKKEQEIVMMKFEAASAALERQKQAMNNFEKALLSLASGSVTDLPGLLQLVLGGGFIGLLSDNIRKNGVIGGLKRNKA